MDEETIAPEQEQEIDTPQPEESSVLDLTVEVETSVAGRGEEESGSLAADEDDLEIALLDEDEPLLLSEDDRETEPEDESEGEGADEDTAEPAPAEPPDDRAWYVIHCYSGYEYKVKHNLEQRLETMQMQDKIFEVVIPTEEEIEVKDGKRRTIERRVFPGYLLVQMIMDDDSWYVVRNTPGVTGFVGMGNRPAPLRPEEVQAIMRRMEAEAPRVKVTFRLGQKVRIVDGPFNEFIGVVDDIDMERTKVRVLVSFFGRDTPVELDFLQVEKV